MTQTLTIVSYVTFDVPDSLSGFDMRGLADNVLTNHVIPTEGIEGCEEWEFMSAEIESVRIDEDPEHNLDSIPAEMVREYLQESVHGNWEGFSPSQQEAFRDLLADMSRYYKATIEPPQ